MIDVPDEIKAQARAIGADARDRRDLLCESHLREVYDHPLSDTFKGSAAYKRAEDLAVDLAEYNGCNWADLDLTVQIEFKEEIQMYFDEEYFSPDEEIQCVQCFSEGDTQIRVSDLDSISADAVLDGKNRSADGGFR